MGDFVRRMAGDRKSADVIVFIFLMVLVLVVYQRALFIYFLSDDFSSIGKFLEWNRPYAAFSGYFRPLPLASLWLDTQWYGLAPHWFRFENLFIHSINAFLVYRFAAVLLTARNCPKEREAAIISGILFAVMACHSEAVVWISCRADLLATLFSLMCLTSYLTWLRYPGRKQFVLYGLSLVGALLSKESAFALPILLIVVTYYCSGHVSIADAVRKLRGMVLASASLLVVLFVIRYMVSGAWLGHEHVAATPGQYLINLANYSYRTLLFPATLAGPNGMPGSLLPFVAIALLAGMPWLARREPCRSTAILLLALFVGALSPALHKTISIDTLQMERYVYLPSVFVCILMAVVISQIKNIFWRYGMTAAYFCLMVIFLNGSIVKWREAGDIARKSLHEIRASFSAEKIFILGLPNAYQGVDVFRNGFPRAVMFFAEVDVRRKFIYMPLRAEIHEKNTVLGLTQVPEGFDVTLKTGRADLMPGDDLAVYDVVQGEKGAMGVRYPEVNKKDYQVYIYCGDRLMAYEHCTL